MREQNASHMMYVLPISKLEPVEYFYQELTDATIYRQLKKAVMSASDYFETRNVRIFMQLTQCCAFIRHLEDE